MEKYELLNQIGEGQATYRLTKDVLGLMESCLELETDKMAALQQSRSLERQKTTQMEIDILNMLKHQHIVDLIETITENKQIFLVFEQLNRTLLEELTLNGGGYSVNPALTGEFSTQFQSTPQLKGLGIDPLEAKKIIWQMVKACDFMHNQKVIHRDIKPENMLLSRNGVLKMCDFGFAKEMKRPGSENLTEYVSTRWYRAPELLLSHPQYSYAVDIWAIGCIYVELVTGRALYMGNSDFEMLQLIIEMFFAPNDLDEQALIEIVLPETLKQSYDNNPIFQNRQLLRHESQSRHSQSISQILSFLDNNAAVSFIEDCLQIDPEIRSSADQLLKHSFFDDFRDWFDDEILCLMEYDQNESEEQAVIPRKVQTRPLSTHFSNFNTQDQPSENCAFQDLHNEIGRNTATDQAYQLPQSANFNTELMKKNTTQNGRRDDETPMYWGYENSSAAMSRKSRPKNTGSSRRSEVSFKIQQKKDTNLKGKDFDINVEQQSFNDTLFGKAKDQDDLLDDSLDREVSAVLKSPTNQEINQIDQLNTDINNISAFATEMSERGGQLGLSGNFEPQLKVFNQVGGSGRKSILENESPQFKGKRTNAKSNNQLQRSFKSVQANPSETFNSRSVMLTAGPDSFQEGVENTQEHSNTFGLDTQQYSNTGMPTPSQIQDQQVKLGQEESSNSSNRDQAPLFLDLQNKAAVKKRRCSLAQIVNLSPQKSVPERSGSNNSSNNNFAAARRRPRQPPGLTTTQHGQSVNQQHTPSTLSSSGGATHLFGSQQSNNHSQKHSQQHRGNPIKTKRLNNNKQSSNLVVIQPKNNIHNHFQHNNSKADPSNNHSRNQNAHTMAINTTVSVSQQLLGMVMEDPAEQLSPRNLASRETFARKRTEIEKEGLANIKEIPESSNIKLINTVNMSSESNSTFGDDQSGSPSLTRLPQLTQTSQSKNMQAGHHHKNYLRYNSKKQQLSKININFMGVDGEVAQRDASEHSELSNIRKQSVSQTNLAAIALGQRNNPATQNMTSVGNKQNSKSNNARRQKGLDVKQQNPKEGFSPRVMLVSSDYSNFPVGPLSGAHTLRQNATGERTESTTSGNTGTFNDNVGSFGALRNSDQTRNITNKTTNSNITQQTNAGNTGNSRTKMVSQAGVNVTNQNGQQKLLLNQSSSGPNLLAPVNPSSTATLSKKNIHSKKPSAFQPKQRLSLNNAQHNSNNSAMLLNTPSHQVLQTSTFSNLNFQQLTKSSIISNALEDDRQISPNRVHNQINPNSLQGPLSSKNNQKSYHQFMSSNSITNLAQPIGDGHVRRSSQSPDTLPATSYGCNLQQNGQLQQLGQKIVDNNRVLDKPKGRRMFDQGGGATSTTSLNDKNSLPPTSQSRDQKIIPLTKQSKSLLKPGQFESQDNLNSYTDHFLNGAMPKINNVNSNTTMDIARKSLQREWPMRERDNQTTNTNIPDRGIMSRLIPDSSHSNTSQIQKHRLKEIILPKVQQSGQTSQQISAQQQYLLKQMLHARTNNTSRRQTTSTHVKTQIKSKPPFEREQKSSQGLNGGVYAAPPAKKYEDESTLSKAKITPGQQSAACLILVGGALQPPTGMSRAAQQNQSSLPQLGVHQINNKQQNGQLSYRRATLNSSSGFAAADTNVNKYQHLQNRHLQDMKNKVYTQQQSIANPQKSRTNNNHNTVAGQQRIPSGLGQQPGSRSQLGRLHHHQNRAAGFQNLAQGLISSNAGGTSSQASLYVRPQPTQNVAQGVFQKRGSDGTHPLMLNTPSQHTLPK